ncbi:hypothetical protein [Nocardia bovistercoris]|uniref:Uncharacterized protein n=1 Tax=Nocardia bovistercoris TaxID=2785916 RepID=A0A931N3U2_9NOCA|nr:hypothetical protein [Nocardia bovistercoris]MBH0776918.1 hypothetical protein [Nocardia bovistercoris]
MTAEARTPEQWARLYVSCGLRGTHSTAPGFVILPLTGEVTAVNTPGALGDRIVGLMPAARMYGPVLARTKPARCTFLTRFDQSPEPETVARLVRHSVDVGPHRANVILPTGFGPVTREDRYWLCSPRQGEPLPVLSALLDMIADHLDNPA